MTITTIIFDLDGTLVDSRDMHYLALNKALASVDQKYTISLEEHLSTYDGLPTKTKLEMLEKTKGLPKDLIQIVNDRKQSFTEEAIMETFKRDDRICEILCELRKQFKIYVASNCIWRNLCLILSKKGFIDYVDWFISNEDVSQPKPSPEMFLKCMIRAKVSPDQVLIVEDSLVGQTAAIASGAKLLKVTCPDDIKLGSIMNCIYPKVKSRPRLNIVIPMAGHGSRFANAGYTFPKPLIEVNGMPMIELVVKNLDMEGNFIFITQKAHYEKYNLDDTLDKIAPGCKIITVDKVTEGAACTVLLAKQYIDNDDPVVIANSDQFVEWSSGDFLSHVENYDAGMATFDSTHPKWSYANVQNGLVTHVAEKKVISNHATVGIYYYRHGNEFVKYAEQMIAKNIRVNGEFYVAPVFNEYILEGKKVVIKDIRKMWGLGVPEDLNVFLMNYKLILK